MQHITALVSIQLGRLVAGLTAVLLTSTALAKTAPRQSDTASVSRTAAAATDCVPQWDTAIGNPGMNGAIWALAAAGNGDLIAGGAFTMAGGTPANRIARWDGSQWHPMGSGFDQGTVMILQTLPNGDLIAGGTFTAAGGVSVNRIARWDGIEWHPLGAGLDNTPWSAVVTGDGDLVVGGGFSTAGGQPAARVARWDGLQWHAMGEGLAEFLTVRALAWFDDGTGGAVYAGGQSPTRKLYRWDGSSWSTVEGGLLVDNVTAMAVGPDGSDSALFVASGVQVATQFIAEEWLAYSAKWGSSGSGWEPLDNHPINRGPAVFDDGSGPALYWGSTGSTPGLVNPSIAKWDGSWWVPVAGGLSGGPVLATAAFDDGNGPSLYVAGGFTSADGEPANYIVRLQHCPPTPPVVHHVPGDFSTIQAAIGAASDGEVIRVGPGTYNEAINFLGKTIVVESEDGPEVTIIDGTTLNAPAVWVPAGSQAGTTLRGFTVTGSDQGVAVGLSSLTIDTCIIFENGDFEVFYGGGIYAWGSSLLVDNSLIEGNFTTVGAGVALRDLSQGRFRDNVIRDNVAHRGAAVSTEQSSAAFIRCTVENNTAQVVGSFINSVGGGMAIGTGSPTGSVYPHFFIDCDFIGNSADHHGAGLFVTMQATASITNCRFVQNEAGENGGGVFGGPHFVSIIGSEFSGNVAGTSGGGIRFFSQVAALKDTVFCENEPEHIAGDYEDLGGNVFSDVCDPAPGDLNGDGVVDVSDLLILLAAWGDCDDPSNCPADLNGDGVVDVTDLLILLGNWG